jgi:hypothetical protein
MLPGALEPVPPAFEEQMRRHIPCGQKTVEKPWRTHNFQKYHFGKMPGRAGLAANARFTIRDLFPLFIRFHKLALRGRIVKRQIMKFFHSQAGLLGQSVAIPASIALL